MTTTKMQTSFETTRVPETWLEYLKSWGPGIVLVLSWLGTGDIVDNSVAGSHYGYTLLWVMTISIFLRFGFVSVLAKYDLCNSNGDTLVQGFNRIGRWSSYYILFASIAYVHLMGSYTLKALATILQTLFPFLSIPVAGIVIILITTILVLGSVYSTIEKLFKFFLLIMGLVFTYGLVTSRPDVGSLVKGAFIPTIPEGGALIAASLIGAVFGTPLNLSYSYFTKEKGWKGPAFVKVARFDLGFSCICMFLIGLAIWATAAAYLYPQGIEVKEASDMAEAFKALIGNIGPVIFYLGLFSAAFTTYAGATIGIGRLCTDILDSLRGSEGKKLKIFGVEKDYVFLGVVVWTMLSPFVWLFVSAGFITITVISSALTGILMPILIALTIILTNKKEYLGQYVNNFGENAVLILGLLFTTYGAIKTISSLIF